MLCCTLGITAPALGWLRSYLGDRTLRVLIDDSFSTTQEILWSVPQASVLGPLLFLIHLLLGILIRKHGLEHAYADDTQKLENCLADIYTWMSQNKLKFNAEKKEVLSMGTPQMQAKISIPSIKVNGVIVPVLNEPVGNLGAVFDTNMNMSAHVSKFIKSTNYHLRDIGKLRKCLNTDTTECAIVSLVTSRLDYCNGLLCGIADDRAEQGECEGAITVITDV